MEFDLEKLEVYSTLDKFLGQLGIYATWLSSIAYLQKQLRILIFFLRHVFFFCDYTFSYCMHEAIGNMLTYLFTPIVCKLADFIVPEANLNPLLTFERVYFAKFHFHLSVFPRNTGLGNDIFMKLEYIACLLVKIKSIPDWHLFICQDEPNGTQ